MVTKDKDVMNVSKVITKKNGNYVRSVLIAQMRIF